MTSSFLDRTKTYSMHMLMGERSDKSENDEEIIGAAEANAEKKWFGIHKQCKEK